jgi:hypothetical protein
MYEISVKRSDHDDERSAQPWTGVVIDKATRRVLHYAKRCDTAKEAREKAQAWADARQADDDKKIADTLHYLLGG